LPPHHMAPLATNAALANENAKKQILTVISPDTELNLKPSTCSIRTYIQMFKKTESLLEVLRQQTAADLQELMGLKKKLAEAYVERFKAFERLAPKQAILLLGGKALGAEDFEDQDLQYTQKCVRMLSGLYGVLRPYDDVRSVRDVPMGAKLKTPRGETLLDFWGESITKQLAKEMSAMSGGGSAGFLLGCVPKEYWRAVQPEMLPKGVIAKRVVFVSDEEKDVRWAYGLLARFMVRQHVEDIARIKQFDADGWGFESSSDTEIVFARRGGNVRRPISGDGSSKKKSKGASKRNGASSSSPSYARRKRKQKSRSSSQARQEKKAPSKRNAKKGTCSESSSSGQHRKKTVGKRESKRKARSESSASSDQRRKKTASRRDAKRRARSGSSGGS